MVREEFGVEPDPWQDEILRAFPHHDRLLMKACKGPGKTCVLAWLAWNFLGTRPHPRIGATSITSANLDSAFMPEMAKWQSRSPFFRNTFHWGKTQIVHREHAGTWFLQARSWPKKADAQQQADALGGLHEDYAMWVCDEMGEYPQSLMATFEAVLSSGIECKILGAGNPTNTTGPLHRACTTDRKLWFVMTVTGDPDNPKAWVHSPRVAHRAPGQLSPLDHAKQQIAQYGRDNPWVMVNILGEFPPSSINALLSVEEVEAAMQRKLRGDVYDWAQKRLGIDVARFGDDRTVMFPRQGLASFMPVVMRNQLTTNIAARVAQAAGRWMPEGDGLILVDDTGHWGHGVIDNLITAGIPGVMPVFFNGKALNPRYKNRRAEMWIQGAKCIQNGGGLPNLPELVGELTAATYTFVGGQFMLEDKDLIKEKIGRSPDLADGYMLTHALEDMPGGMLNVLKRTSTAKRDADPYEAPGAAERDFDPNEWREDR